ncbi:MAG: type II secretion system protein GspK [Planctomycetaceae bacterium]
MYPLSESANLNSPRKGTALLVVLVVIVLLSLVTYTFTQTMIVEANASLHYAHDAQARELANSGVDYVAALLTPYQYDEPFNSWHDPSMFAGVMVVDASQAEGIGRFTVIAPLESDSMYRGVRYGLTNQSSLININTIVNEDLDEETMRWRLMVLPNMTEDVADAILDWVDKDTEQRSYGAEDDSYLTLGMLYGPANGPLESIDQLLLVVGVTPELLYGEDVNRNGILDPNEDDGETSLPYDNADGILDLGWSAFLTVHSRESNLGLTGETKLDVNQGLLTELYDSIELAFDAETALFITAYRANGATNVDPLPESSVNSGNTTGDTTTDEILNNLAQGLVKSVLQDPSQSSVTRGGLDLSKGATVEIDSLFELIGAEVDVVLDGQPTTLVSPFTADSQSLQFLYDNFTTNSSTAIDGRININEARYETLMSIPWMTEELASAILSARPITADGTADINVMAQRTNIGWLLSEQLADLMTVRLLDRYATTSGTVFKAQVIGCFSGPGPVSRIEAVIDATEAPPQILFRRDLTNLGPGYTTQQLLPMSNEP